MIRYILHHTDADGYCAAAIVGRASIDKFSRIEYIPVNYSIPPPWEELKEAGPHDEIWMVDFSYDETTMLRMIEKVGPSHFFWLDHHKTALTDLADLDIKVGRSVPGIRDESMAGCMLAWVFCHKNTPPPLAVTYISDQDTWTFKHGDTTRYFNEMHHLEIDATPESLIWDQYFKMSNEEYEIYQTHGKMLYTARIEGLRKTAIKLGREVRLPPPHDELKVLKLNYPGNGDLGQLINDMGYDIAWCYYERESDGVLKRFNSLYSETVNVGEIAKSRGGGGHSGSAAFRDRVRNNM